MNYKESMLTVCMKLYYIWVITRLLMEVQNSLPFIDSHNCVSEDVVHTVQNIKSIGLSKYQKYVSDVL